MDTVPFGYLKNRESMFAGNSTRSKGNYVPGFTDWLPPLSGIRVVV